MTRSELKRPDIALRGIEITRARQPGRPRLIDEFLLAVADGRKVLCEQSAVPQFLRTDG